MTTMDQASTQSEDGGRQLPQLTKFLRLTVYSFLDFQESVLTLTRLGRREREALLNSQIARENKTFKLELRRRDSEDLPWGLDSREPLDGQYSCIKT